MLAQSPLLTSAAAPCVQIVTAADRPDLRAAGDSLAAAVWPAFLDGDAATIECWDRLFERGLDRFQLFALRLKADGSEELVATANSVPFVWSSPEDDESLPDGGWDAVLVNGVAARTHGHRPNALSALSVVVSPGERGGEIAGRMILAMRDLARENGFQAMVVPIRPTRKSHYPLESMATYLSWQTAGGEPFDPWVRKHYRLGARVIGIAGRSMEVRATVAEWERWSGLRFPVSGRYHIAGGLAPVEIDLRSNRGLYLEPNVWMRHF